MRALRPLPQRQDPNPPQWYVLGPRYTGSNIHKCLQSKQEPSVPVASSILVLSRDRKSKAFSSRTADPSSLRPVMHQSKIPLETKCNSIKLAFLLIEFLINDLITTNNLDFMFHNETWLEDTCSATVLNEAAPPNFNFTNVCRTVRRGGVAALFKNVYKYKQVSFDQYLSFEYLGILLKGAPRIMFIIIYRPPKYSPAFVEEFTEL